MKIVVIQPYYTPGVHDYVLELCEGLSHKGNELIIFTTSLLADNRVPNNFMPRIRTMQNNNKIQIKRINTINFGPIPIIPLLTFYLIKEKPDIILTGETFQFFSLQAAFASKILRIPLVLRQALYKFPPSSIFLKTSFFIIESTIGKIVRKFTNIFIATTPMAKKYLLKTGVKKEKIKIIPLGIDLNNFQTECHCDFLRKRLKIKEDAKVILTVARLTYLKGINYLLYAICEVLKHIPNVTLIIIGFGEQKLQIKDFLKKWNIESKVILIDFVPHEVIKYYYFLADLFVLPTLYENFGIVILEAMASGTPVVATKVGGIPYLVKDGKTGILVRPAYSSDMAKTIVYLLCNDDLRIKMGEYARQRVEKEFSWNNIIDEYQKILYQLDKIKCE